LFQTDSVFNIEDAVVVTLF